MTNNVVAKFFVTNVQAPPEGTSQAAVVSMQAVCRGRENSTWASATPWATLQMGIKNEMAVENFEPGEEYLLTFEHVAKPQQGDSHLPIPARYHGGEPDDFSDPTAAICCSFCGVFAKRNDDGSLDWSDHHEHFGRA